MKNMHYNVYYEEESDDELDDSFGFETNFIDITFNVVTNFALII